MIYIVLIVLLIVIFFLVKKIKIQQSLILKKNQLLMRQAKLASIGEMLEHIAHQWKQPLAQINSVILNIDTNFEDGKLTKEKLEEDLNQIENLTIFMSDTIESFRNYLHPDKEKTTFFIKEAFDDTFALIEPLLKHKKIDCSLHVKSDMSITGYKKEFVQTLLVLLNNAKDALLETKPKNPFIKIVVEKFQNRVVVEICDNGGGIEPKNLDKIFDPYFTTKKESKGTGHGLSMAKMIIEESMGGELSVTNSKDGACFRIVL